MAILEFLAGLILLIFVIGVAWWVIQELIKISPLPEVFNRLIYILLMIVLAVVIFFVLVQLFSLFGLHVPFVGKFC